MPEICPYCRESVAPEDQYQCPECQTPHHIACWEENRGCTVFGCRYSPTEGTKATAQDFGFASAPPPDAAQYFLSRSGSEYGPYTTEQLRGFLASGNAFPSDFVWSHGMPAWTPLQQFLNQAPAQGGAFAPTGSISGFDPSRAKPPSNLGTAIAVTLLCCLPFGIVAIVYASQVDGKYAAGDFDGAKRASDNAMTWCWVSFGLGLAVGFIYFIGQAN